MKPERKTAPSIPTPLAARLFAALFGAFLALTLLKFGNPPIMSKWEVTPITFVEIMVGTPWPLNWAYRLMVAVIAVAVFGVFRLKPRPPLWLTLLPALWLVWQIAAGANSVDKQLSHATLMHFLGCVVCFYLGLFALSRVEDLQPFFIGLLCGLALVFAIGFDQHFGGLAESRKYFYRQMELYPLQRETIPPEFIKKIESTRIYSTLFYPNTLAGVVLLFLPLMLVATPKLQERLQGVSSSRMPVMAAILGTALACLYLYLLNSHVGWILVLLLGLAMILPVPNWVPAIVLGLGAGACLFWSGSKGGWLLLLFLGLLVLLRVPFGKRLKVGLVTISLVGGLAGFFIKYAGFFRKGATSVVARFDYWCAALQTAGEHPILGTGPGTFSIPYQVLKRPESEMARLVHNDYLEQASDSGIPSLLAYSSLIIGGLIWTYRRTVLTAETPPEARLRFALWLGLLGFALQGLFEFPAYIPALGWPAFAFLGLLLGKAR